MKMFEMYQHKYNTDVAIYPMTKYYAPTHDTFSLKVRWFNVVNEMNIFDMGLVETIEIKRKDMDNWKEYK